MSITILDQNDKQELQQEIEDELYSKLALVWEEGAINGDSGIPYDATGICRTVDYIDARNIHSISATTAKLLFAYDADYRYLGKLDIPQNTTFANADIFALNSDIRYIIIRSNWGETPDTVVGTVEVLIDKRIKNTHEQVDALNKEVSNHLYQEKEMPWQYGWYDGNTGSLLITGETFGVVNMEKILVAEFKELTIDEGAYNDNGDIGSFYVRCYAHDKDGNLVGIIHMSSVGNEGFKQEDVKALSSNAHYFNVLVTRDSSTSISVDKVKDRVHIICAFADNRLTAIENQEYWLKQRRRFSDKPIMVAYSQGANLGRINTELAYVNAAIAGFEWLKGDIQPTSDGKLIMCHDDGFTFNSDGYITNYDASNKTLIKDMTYAECMSKEYDISYLISTGGKAYRPKVCDLEKFLLVCREFGCRPYIVIRDYRDTIIGATRAYKVVKELLRLLDKYDFTENCIVNSFVLGSVKKVAEMSNHRVMISTVTGYDNGVIPTTADIDNILKASPNCTINFFANLSDGWDNEALMDAAKDTIDYAKSLGIVVGTSAVSEPHGVLQKGIGLCQCQTPCIDTKVTPILLCIQILNGVASAVVWNGIGARHTADVSVSGNTIVLENIRIRGSSREFADGVTPSLASIFPYDMTAVSQYTGITVESINLYYASRVEINLTTPISELDTSSAKRIFVKFTYGM